MTKYAPKLFAVNLLKPSKQYRFLPIQNMLVYLYRFLSNKILSKKNGFLFHFGGNIYRKPLLGLCNSVVHNIVNTTIKNGNVSNYFHETNPDP